MRFAILCTQCHNCFWQIDKKVLKGIYLNLKPKSQIKKRSGFATSALTLMGCNDVGNKNQHSDHLKLMIRISIIC